jgi:hypothetical protein
MTETLPTPRRSPVTDDDSRTPAEIVAERLRILEAFVAEHGLTYWDGQYGAAE